MRIAICVEYDGTNYSGWQRQLEKSSIQAELELALSKIANEPIKTTCAGRTDAGVHAFGQIVHFDTSVVRPQQAWVLGTNSLLPADIKVQWAKAVADNFSARFSAIARTYRYVIFNSKIPSAILRNRTMWCPYDLDEKLMQEAANYLIGEHDFSSFRGGGCQSRTPMRFVEKITITRNANIINIEIKANAFLLHMVRNIVGMLINIGTQKKAPLWAQEVLQARDRKKNGITAPPQGLYLLNVDYLSL